MRLEIIIFLSILAIWAFSVAMFRRLKLDFFKFIVGSLGLFIITVIYFIDPLENLLINSLTYVLNIIGSGTEWFSVISDFAIVSIYGKVGGVLNMSITYQCSGVIELLVFSCLVIFFPFISTFKKISTLILGNVYLFICNIIRILFIVAAVKIFGVHVFEFTHLILARILFFMLSIAIYYKVFTKNQLKKQKVGEIR